MAGYGQVPWVCRIIECGWNLIISLISYGDSVDFDSAFGWVGAEGEFEGRPLLVRFRQFPTTFNKASYPSRLNIFWKMREPEEWGLPTQFEMERLEAFENRLVEAVESDNHSILSVVLTCNGQREFVFHTSNPEGFLQRLTAMPQEQERYPIEIYHAEDPEWEYDATVTSSN